jgi:hypothetical protein
MDFKLGDGLREQRGQGVNDSIKPVKALHLNPGILESLDPRIEKKHAI